MDGGKKGRFRLIHLLLIVPFVATLWVPFYNSTQPELAGIPFFYWYQLLWVALTALILFIVYLAEGGE
jgi:uncharacterized membrane protein AbrB (regulator of aidB expression)